MGVFFRAEDGIRDLVRSRGLGMCIRDRPHLTIESSLVDPNAEDSVHPDPGMLRHARNVPTLSLIHI